MATIRSLRGWLLLLASLSGSLLLAALFSIGRRKVAPPPPPPPFPYEPTWALSRTKRINTERGWAKSSSTHRSELLSKHLTDVHCMMLPLSTLGIQQECWNDLRRRQFLAVLDEIYSLPAKALERFQPQQHWQIFDLITPTYGCDANTLRRIGAPNDGGKWICGPIRVTGPKCVVFSMGSNNQFDFEEAIAFHTGPGQCEIHTFDCTGQWSNKNTHYHPWCLGGEDRVDQDGKIFKRLNTIVRELGVTGLTLLKMDIEHGEYDVFESLKRAPEEFLPDHILVELHTSEYPKSSRHANDWVKTIIDMVRDNDAMGYSVAFQERTIGCGLIDKSYFSEKLILFSLLFVQ